MQHGPRGDVTLAQVEFDDVAGEGTVVVEGPIVDHVACANPVVRQLVGVSKTAWERYRERHETGRRKTKYN